MCSQLASLLKCIQNSFGSGLFFRFQDDPSISMLLDGGRCYFASYLLLCVCEKLGNPTTFQVTKMWFATHSLGTKGVKFCLIISLDGIVMPDIQVYLRKINFRKLLLLRVQWIRSYGIFCCLIVVFKCE